MSSNSLIKSHHTQIGRCYSVKHSTNGIIYDIHFPVLWAMEDNFTKAQKQKRENVGSVQCESCRKHGSFRGVFVQYCKKCVDTAGKPGCHCNVKSMVPDSFEKTSKTIKLYGYPCDHSNCVFNTYLHSVDLLTIGTKKVFTLNR
jgi:hypothetical protein